MNAAANAMVDGDVDALKMNHDWIAAVSTSRGERRICSRKSLGDILRRDILVGELSATAPVDVHAKGQDGRWAKATVPLAALVPREFRLRVLYQPIWSHSLAGLKWGALVGIALKLLDTFVLLSSRDPTLAVLFLVAIGACFIPRIGWTAMIGVSIVMSKFTKVNLFFALVGAGLAGAILGCLPGMAVGGIVGLVRRRRLTLAPDAEREPANVVWKAVVAPVAAACVVWAGYLLVVTPWLVGRR